MNRTIFNRIRGIIEPQIDASIPCGDLTTGELETLQALLVVLADDANYDRAGLCRYLVKRAQNEPGILGEYRHGIEVIDEAAQKQGGKPFAELSREEQETLLDDLLPQYPHPLSEAPKLYETRLTRRNLFSFLSPRRVLRLRLYVIADLLSYYYSTAPGWAVVGYRDFPGFSRIETDPCEVIAFELDGNELILELSDATYERLRPYCLYLDEQERLWAKTKSGRQRAMFSRHAYLALSERLEVTDEGEAVLTVGNQIHRIATPS